MKTPSEEQPVCTAQCALSIDCTDLDSNATLKQVAGILEGRSLWESGRAYSNDGRLGGVFFKRGAEFQVSVAGPLNGPAMKIDCYWFAAPALFEPEVEMLRAELAEAFPNRVKLFEPISTGPW
jgi:hypothetical protein